MPEYFLQGLTMGMACVRARLRSRAAECGSGTKVAYINVKHVL